MGGEGRRAKGERGQRGWRRRVSVFFLSLAAACLGAGSGLLGVCGPFTDVSDPGFCPFVLEIFFLGITTGTTPTTYDPASSVTRLQMAAFLSRTVDRTLQRASSRAVREQFWTPVVPVDMGVTTLPSNSGPFQVKSDGEDLWVANSIGSVSRVRGSDGKLLETWTAGSAMGVLVAMGRVFVTGATSPGKLYRIDPSQPAGAATTVATNLGDQAFGMAFDGGRIWTANFHNISIVTPTLSLPYTVTTVATGFTDPAGILYDGSNVWVADLHLLKLNATGGILQTVTVGLAPAYPVFDGTNIWVPNRGSDSVSVVRASTGAVLAVLTGNGLLAPYVSAFDGQRVLVASTTGTSVSLWKAADLTPLGSSFIGGDPGGACSDGTNFWIVLSDVSQLVRF